MKKIPFYSLLVAAAMMGGVMTSCSEDPAEEQSQELEQEPGGGNTGGENNGNDNGNGNSGGVNLDDDHSGDGLGNISPNAQSPEQQQAKMQQVGQNFLGYVSAEDFVYWRDLANHINRKFVDSERYANDVVEDWFDNLASATKIGEHTEHEEGDYGWEDYHYYYYYYYHYTDYKKLVLLSTIHGKFTAGETAWTKEQANDLQFVINDQNGAQAVLTLVHSGSTKRVHIVNVEDWYDSAIEDVENGDIYHSYINNDQYYIEVPEKITVTYTVNGQQRLRSEITLDLSSITSENLDLNTHKLNADAKVTLDNYTIHTSNIAYAPNSTASAAVSVAKDGVTLLAASCEAGSWQLIGAGADLTEADDWDVEFTGGAAKLRINILGQMQLNAVVSDAKKFFDAAEDADEYCYGDASVEQPFKQAVATMNQCIQSGIYYDGNAEKQASFRFEPLLDWYSTADNEYEWEYYPVIVFNNGTSYSLIEESTFFNENSFKALVDLFNDLYDDFEDLSDGLDF